MHGIQRDRNVPRIQPAVELRPAGPKLLGHCLFCFPLVTHGLRKLPSHHPLDRDRFNFFPDSFLLGNTVESRTAVACVYDPANVSAAI